MPKFPPVQRRAESKWVRKAYRIAVDIGISVERRAVGDRAGQDVLIYEPLDINVIISRSHVIQTVQVGSNAPLSGVQEYDPFLIFRKQFSVRTVIERFYDFSGLIGYRLGISEIIEVISKIFFSALLRNKPVTVNKISCITLLCHHQDTSQ